MNLSPKGLNLLKKLEGFEPKPYYCSAGKKTIGYGHVLLPSENFTEITIDTANALLKKDVMWAERAINKRFSDLTQNQFDALVCFVFNVGETEEFSNSNVLKYIKLREYETAISYWKQWNKELNEEKVLVISRGLQNRRNAEISLFKGSNI